MPCAEGDRKPDGHELTLSPNSFVDYTVGKKSAKAAEKSAPAPLAPATDPSGLTSQGGHHQHSSPCQHQAQDIQLQSHLSLPPTGDVDKAVTELIIDFDVNPEEESPYEALYNATSCHSLDSLASGRSSDRESGNKEAEPSGLKAAGVRPVCSSPLLALETQGADLQGQVLQQLEEIFKSFPDIDESRQVPLLPCPVHRDCLKAAASSFHLVKSFCFLAVHWCQWILVCQENTFHRRADFS